MKKQERVSDMTNSLQLLELDWKRARQQMMREDVAKPQPEVTKRPPYHPNSDSFVMKLDEFPALPEDQKNPTQQQVAKEIPHFHFNQAEQLNLPATPTPSFSLFQSGSILNQSSGNQGEGPKTGPPCTQKPTPLQPNPYGLLALTSTLMTKPSQNQPLDRDLNKLGLGMMEGDGLTFFSKFGGPFAVGELSAIDMDYSPVLPPEYQVSSVLGDKGSSSKLPLTTFKEDTLFYLFYNMPQDVTQIHVASELYRRNWRYHKKLQIWLQKVPDLEPFKKGATFEVGMYYYFDVPSWKYAQRVFHVEYHLLEGAPLLIHDVGVGE